MRGVWLGAIIALAMVIARQASAASFVAFESGPVRPLALSPDGTRVFVVNTPDGRLEIFRVTDGGLEHEGAVPVGLEPVAVAARTPSEVWVVNHLSDSVSIVDVDADPPRVVRTLLVGDEPRDIVFGGPNGARAFITTAHRGQNDPIDPQLTTPGVGRADVWVFDATDLGSAFGGTPLTIVTLLGDTPRALATTADGGTVYAAVFHSGNRTTAVNEHTVCDGSETAQCSIEGVEMPGGLPDPRANVEGVPGPEVGLIVKRAADGSWMDELGRDWRAAVRFDLPDEDVFAIDALADPPQVIDRYAGVGTILFNMAVNPRSGLVYVSNTDARNDVRFSGPGTLAGHTVRGHLHEARITVIDPASGAVTPRHLNKHIDYAVVPSPPDTKARSLATPLEMAVSSDGATLYLAAFGSGKIGVFRTAELENDAFVPDAADHIALSGGGPGGVVLDEARGRLYVLTRFDNAVSIVDVERGLEVAHLPLYNPEPPAVVNGRRFLYDADFTSSNGEVSCSSCHVFGDVDDLGWDLGNPDAVVQPFGEHFHPMKGPMTVQTLRGLATHGPLHWRGDRNAANFGGDFRDTRQAFQQFNEAFETLLGRDSVLTDPEMAAYTEFVMQILPPPNPIRALDDSPTADQAEGERLFRSGGPGIGCSCHVLMPERGFYGTDGSITPALETQLFKVPHLRNLYTRVGMFGMASGSMFEGPNTYMGDQIRGFGFLHDGSIDTLFRFLTESLFSLSEPQRRQVESFLLAFPSNLAPVVGQQVTLTDPGEPGATARLDLFVAQAAMGASDLTAKGVSEGELRGWYRSQSGVFLSDRAGEPPLADAELRALASAEHPLTYTCVPPGAGIRVGIDRDEDGAFDRDEIDWRSDPADAADRPNPTKACLGDCDGDGMVGVEELIRGVDMALDTAPLRTCPLFDSNFDGAIAIAELIRAVANALEGCPAVAPASVPPAGPVA